MFEGAYVDRSLEVTGQQMVVITPGAGMFEVDRELATITKQRIVDNGKIIIDLCCNDLKCGKLMLHDTVARPAQHLVIQMQIFQCLQTV